MPGQNLMLRCIMCLLWIGNFRTFPQLSHILLIFSACHMIWSIPNSCFLNFIYFRIPYFHNLVLSSLWSAPHLIVYSGFVGNNGFIVLQIYDFIPFFYLTNSFSTKSVASIFKPTLPHGRTPVCNWKKHFPQIIIFHSLSTYLILIILR